MVNIPNYYLVWLVDSVFVAPTWHAPGVSALLSLHFGCNHIDLILRFRAGINNFVDGYSLFVTDLREEVCWKEMDL